MKQLNNTTGRSMKMMMKLLGAAFFILHSSFFISCAGEEDDIFDKSAAERLNESSAKYSARLEAQPNGWAMQYYPTYDDEAPYGTGYLILMDFNPDFSVKVAMDNNFSRNVYWEDTSAWEVIKDNGPVLSFNTYNRCMHAFSDPEDILWTDESEQSEGCAGDYEFIIVDAPEDASYMMLKGKKRNTYNLLTPIEEGVDYQDYLADVKAFHNKVFSANAPTGCYLCFGPDSIYNMDDGNGGVPNIYPVGTDAIANESFNPFLITKRGVDYYLRFRDAFEKDFMEGELQELRYDSIQDQFVGVDEPQFIIKGQSPYDFFTRIIDEQRQRWEWSDALAMSDAYAEAYGTIADDFKTQLKYTLLNMCFRVNREILTYRIQYKSGKSTMNIDYNFSMERDGESVTFTFDSDFNKVSTNTRELVPSVQAMIDLLQQRWIVDKSETSFDLSRVRLVLASDPNVWFTLSLV
jgi:hypothetical protein